MTAFLETVVLLVSGALLGAALGAILRRLLNAPIGWPRSILTGALLLIAVVPLGTSVGQFLGVFGDDHSILVGPGVLTIFLILLVLWSIVIAAAVLVGLELVWPTPPWRGLVGTFRTHRNAAARFVRYNQILRIVSVTGLRRALREGIHPGDSHLNDALLEMLNRAGGTFIKFGQFLSTQVGAIPPDLAETLSSLQTQAAPIPFEDVEKVLREELGADPDTVFKELDREPLAAASVAQVHRGVLRDGTEVAIKVQRPGIRQQILVDGDIMTRLADTFERTQPWASDMNLVGLTKGLVGSLINELDYRIEARNLRIARGTLRPDSVLVVPRVHDAHSTRRVLVMDYLPGVVLTDAAGVADELRADPDEAEQLASALAGEVLASVLETGFFHADLHPGNIVLLTNHKLGLVDFGSVGVLDDETRRLLATFLLGLFNGDAVTATDALVLAFDTPAELDVDALRRSIGQEITILLHMETFDPDQMARVFTVLREHRIGVPSSVAAAFRTIASLTRSLQVISPGSDVVEIAMSEVPQIVLSLNGPRAKAARALGTASIASTVLARMPQRIERTTSDLLAGNLSVKVRSFADPRDTRWMRSMVDHVLSGVLSCAAVIAAVILITADGGPRLTAELSFYAVLGYTLALVGFILALRVVVRLFASRRVPDAAALDRR